MVKLLVTGSRDWPDEDTVRFQLGRALEELIALADNDDEEFLLVHGDCPTGADAMADRIWREMGLPVLPRPALWGVWHKVAGPLRNAHMVSDIGANLCLAFIGPGSKGAAGCAKLAKKAGIPVWPFKL